MKKFNAYRAINFLAVVAAVVAASGAAHKF